MAAAAHSHSNRSPSPLSTRPTNPRNPETNPPSFRRSFSGPNGFTKPSVVTNNARRLDPNTPANSPSDFSRRRSVGKEFSSSNLKDCEEKENEERDHNLKASKLRSPAKGSKNFMSPTISAASKFTPSPRKKVLAERNDPLRTSVSISDGKVMFFTAAGSDDSEVFETKSEMGCDQNPNLPVESSLDLKGADSERKEAVHVPKPSKKVTFVNVPSYSHDESEPLQESVITDSCDGLKLESSLKNSLPVSPSIAPLDADPSLPPYDPKTNYLSPRPQFLYYKPNPRIEILLNKEKGLDPEEFKKLEDSFMAEVMSENFSDSEGTEESQTEEDSQKEEELDVAASTDLVLGVDEAEADAHLSEPAEPLPVSTISTDAISVEKSIQKKGKKPHFSKCLSFSILVLFLIAWVSISVNHSPAFDHLVIKDLSLSDVSNFYHQSSFAASVEENFYRVKKVANQLLVDSLSFFSKLIDKLGKGGTQGSLQFMNLSELQEDVWNGGHFLNKDVVENVEEDEMEEDMEIELDEFEEEVSAEVENFEDDDTSEIESLSIDPVMVAEVEAERQENIQVREKEEVVSSTSDEQSNHEKSEISIAIQQDESKKSEVDTVEVEIEEFHRDSNVAFEIKILPEVETVDIESDRSEIEKFHYDSTLGSSASTDTILLEDKKPLGVEFGNEEVQGSVSMESPPEKSEDKHITRLAAGTMSVFVVLLTVAALVYKAKRNSSLSKVVMKTGTLLKNKSSHEFAAKQHIHLEKRFSNNWQTEVDLMGESCPSEMSSFQNTASYSTKDLRRAGEVQSSEKKPRRSSKRESFASSTEFSVGSASYGSFTTFERIPIKHANGGEEIVTPVRRSSRINKQVTSP